MVTTIAFCPCHSVRVTFTIVVGKVAIIAKRWVLELVARVLWHAEAGICPSFLILPLVVPSGFQQPVRYVFHALLKFVGPAIL